MTLKELFIFYSIVAFIGIAIYYFIKIVKADAYDKLKSRY